jgi:colanic acid/amylovoran biosynthesis glycosyltransferase
MTIAYLANRFPEPLESYVAEEICELRKHDCTVLSCSVYRPAQFATKPAADTRYLFPLHMGLFLTTTWLCLRNFGAIADLIWRVVRGREPISRRCRTLIHTWLGAYLSVLLKKEKVQHIHVHHGYFAAWVGMVAARLLDAGFSVTLHGSDLLVRADYLDTKLAACRFCITVSDFNRRYIAEHYPQIDSRRIFVQHLGVDVDFWRPLPRRRFVGPLSILSVGRLHPTKSHAFLLLACAALKAQGVAFRCAIAGEGDERVRLERMIARLGLASEVTLCGYVPRERLPGLYADADAVVLSSRSEGLPVTLMEAMAMERVVLAPNITGIPELVTDGSTGFLYTPDSMGDFLSKLRSIHVTGPFLDAMRYAARRKVDLQFNARKNLTAFAQCFLKNARGIDLPAFDGSAPRKETDENPVLQQVQLHLQRDRSLPV